MPSNNGRSMSMLGISIEPSCMCGSVEPSSVGGACGTGRGGSVVVGALVVVVGFGFGLVVVGAAVVGAAVVGTAVDGGAEVAGGVAGAARENCWVSSAPPPQPASSVRANAKD